MTEAQALRSWLHGMPKAELHLHLDGSLRPATALELARSRPHDVGRLPNTLAGMRRRMVAPERCADQAELLRAFDLPVALLQDAEALARVAAELVEDVAGEGTTYAEIRWAPSLHTERGLALRDGMVSVAEATATAAREHGVEMRLIAVALRTHDPATAVEVARAALELLDLGLTGFDIAGVEAAAPDPLIFDEAVEVARAGGLGITCHAGEWGGAAQVWRALELRPWRIAHGAPAVDDEGLQRELIDRGVPLDLCPTSNLQAGIGTADRDAPLPRLIRAGVPVTINTDDRTVSDLTLVRELERSVELLGVRPADIALAMRQAYASAFLHHDEAVRAELARAFETWLAANPAPAGT